MIRPLTMILATLLAAAALADQPALIVYEIDFAPGEEASILMYPDGSGPSLTEAVVLGGDEVDATIGIWLMTDEGVPIADFPPEDIWLQWVEEPETLDGCLDYGPNHPGGVFIADAATDIDGWTAFTQPLRGGGWSAGPVTVFVNGEPAEGPWGSPHPPVPLRANSPDLSGDRQVNLTDITLFIQDYFGEYAYRSDLRWDGVINLTDISLFAQGVGMVCP